MTPQSFSPPLAEKTGQSAECRPIPAHQERTRVRGWALPHARQLGLEQVGVILLLGNDTYCVSNDAKYRLDTPSARAFLGQFVTLP
jgi:hypothetical protein